MYLELSVLHFTWNEHLRWRLTSSASGPLIKGPRSMNKHREVWSGSWCSVSIWWKSTWGKQMPDQSHCPISTRFLFLLLTLQCTQVMPHLPVPQPLACPILTAKWSSTTRVNIFSIYLFSTVFNLPSLFLSPVVYCGLCQVELWCSLSEVC